MIQNLPSETPNTGALSIFKRNYQSHVSMSNDELDREIGIAAQEFPFYGIRQMRGYLISKGIRVSWQKIRESM